MNNTLYTTLSVRVFWYFHYSAIQGEFNICTICFVTSSQENLQKQDKVNSLPTQAPIGEPQQNIVQSSPDEFDAVAKAEISKMKKEINNKIKITWESMKEIKYYWTNLYLYYLTLFA